MIKQQSIFLSTEVRAESGSVACVGGWESGSIGGWESGSVGGWESGSVGGWESEAGNQGVLEDGNQGVSEAGNQGVSEAGVLVVGFEGRSELDDIALTPNTRACQPSNIVFPRRGGR